MFFFFFFFFFEKLLLTTAMIRPTIVDFAYRIYLYSTAMLHSAQEVRSCAKKKKKLRWKFQCCTFQSENDRICWITESNASVEGERSYQRGVSNSMRFACNVFHFKVKGLMSKLLCAHLVFSEVPLKQGIRGSVAHCSRLRELNMGSSETSGRGAAWVDRSSTV